MTLRNNVKETKIPSYSRTQEIFNFASHVIGVPLGIFICVMGFLKNRSGDAGPIGIAGLLIFGISALIVYLISSLYHITKSDSPKKKILRILDHCTIYLLIAGTYTPVCFALLKPNAVFFLAIFMLSFEWIGVVIGSILNAFFFQNPAARIISFALYVLMGWLAVICGAFLFISLNSFLYILFGGIVYTIGSVLYAFGHEWKWFHTIFHVCVLLGTVIQMIGVFLLY